MRLANARMHRARVHSACIAVRNGIMLSTRVCTAVSFMRVGVVATAARAVLLVRGRMHRSIPFSMMDIGAGNLGGVYFAARQRPSP